MSAHHQIHSRADTLCRMICLCRLLSANLTFPVTLSCIPLLCPSLSLASLSFTSLGTEACTVLCLSLPPTSGRMRDTTYNLGPDSSIFWPHQHHRWDLISLLSISAPPPSSSPFLPSSSPSFLYSSSSSRLSAFPLFPSGNDSHICLPPAPPASQTFIGRGRARADFSLQRPQGCGRQWAVPPWAACSSLQPCLLLALLGDVWLSLGPWREPNFFS